MTEISIVAATFYGNRGAEGMLSTTMGALRERGFVDLGFNVFTYYPTRDRQLVNDPQVATYSSTPAYLVAVLLPCAMIFRLLGWFGLRSLQRLLPSSVQALARSRALVCLAGVSFVQGRTKFIPFNIATILPAMILGVPVVKFAQAMGPFKTQPNRLAAKLFLGRCEKIFTRGEKTHSYMRELLGESSHYQRADDVAFLFKPSYCISEAAPGLESSLAQLEAHRSAGKIIVGVCPSVVIAIQAKKAGWDYPQRMRELVSRLVGEGYCVALYPNATRAEDMDKTHNNDLPLLQEILAGLDAETRASLVNFSGSLNAAQIHHIIKSCDVHAVSRFHAMVAALALSVPVMVIGWSHKYLEVMERFGQQDMVFDYNKGDVGPVVDCVRQLVEHRAEHASTIAAALPAVQALSRVQIDYLAQLLQSPA